MLQFILFLCFEFQIYRTAQYMNRENDIAFEDYFKFDNHIVLCYVAVSN